MRIWGWNPKSKLTDEPKKIELDEDVQTTNKNEEQEAPETTEDLLLVPSFITRNKNGEPQNDISDIMVGTEMAQEDVLMDEKQKLQKV